jgi:hypothetical protein
MNPNPGVIEEDNRDLIPFHKPGPNDTCIGANCPPPRKNITHFDIDCSGPDCLIPFPAPNDTCNNQTIKCTPGLDCPCTKGVDCPCTKGD